MNKPDAVNKLIVEVCILALDNCIEKCQEYIDSCQKFADKCSTGDMQECAKEVGICKKRSRACLKACQEAIIRSEDYLSESTVPAVIEMVDQAVQHAKACAASCRATLAACDEDAHVCNAVTLEGLEKATRCSHACSRAITSIKKHNE